MWETVTNRVPNTQLGLDAQTNTWLWQALYQPQPEIDYPSGFVSTGGELELQPWLDLSFLLHTGEIRSGASLTPPLEPTVTMNGEPVITALKNLTWLRELVLTAHRSPWTWRLGKRRVTLAQGLLYDDFALGAGMVLEDTTQAATSWSGQFDALWIAQSPQDPTPKSPLIFARVAYNLSFFESIGIYGAFFDDTAGSLGDVLAAAVAERIVVDAPKNTKQARLTDLFGESRSRLGSIFYGGMDASVVPVRGVRFNAAALLQRGHLTFSPVVTRPLSLSLSGWAAQASVAAELAPAVTLTALGFALSGDEPRPSATTWLIAAILAWHRSILGVACFSPEASIKAFFPGVLRRRASTVTAWAVAASVRFGADWMAA